MTWHAGGVRSPRSPRRCARLGPSAGLVQSLGTIRNGCRRMCGSGSSKALAHLRTYAPRRPGDSTSSTTIAACRCGLPAGAGPRPPPGRERTGARHARPHGRRRSPYARLRGWQAPPARSWRQSGRSGRACSSSTSRPPASTRAPASKCVGRSVGARGKLLRKGTAVLPTTRYLEGVDRLAHSDRRGRPGPGDRRRHRRCAESTLRYRRHRCTAQGPRTGRTGPAGCGQLGTTRHWDADSCPAADVPVLAPVGGNVGRSPSARRWRRHGQWRGRDRSTLRQESWTERKGAA
jgi:hypothetical protein